MLIEKIVKKNELNVIVFFDNSEKLFLSYEVLLKNGLRKNMEISEDRYSELITENQKFFIKQAALRLLARRLHSVFELKLKLKKKKYDASLIEDVLTELKEKNLLNDFQFAEIFTEEKIRTKLWGRQKLKSELMKKGISREIIEELLNKQFSDELNLSMAVTLAKKKIISHNFSKLDSSQAKNKMINYLMAKGYDFITAKSAAEQVIKENPDN